VGNRTLNGYCGYGYGHIREGQPRPLDETDHRLCTGWNVSIFLNRAPVRCQCLCHDKPLGGETSIRVAVMVLNGLSCLESELRCPPGVSRDTSDPGGHITEAREAFLEQIHKTIRFREGNASEREYLAARGRYILALDALRGGER
jgi:hypothetical protein